MAEIKASKIEVEDLFNKKWFTIPNYQRPYVWEKENVEALLDNINDFKLSEQKKEKYFLGSLVLQKTGEDGSGENYEVLDGQQRLTTLLLILSVIRDLMDTWNIHNREKVEIQCQLRNLIKCSKNQYNCIFEDRNRIKFSVRGKTGDFCKKFVYADLQTEQYREEDYNAVTSALKDKYENIEKRSKDKNVDISVKNMSAALSVIYKYFTDKTKFRDEEAVFQFASKLMKNTLLIMIWTEDQEDALRIFTILNSTGVKLTNADILKAENLRVIKDEKAKDKFAEQWEEIEKYFNGKNNKGDGFDRFLTFILDIYLKQKAEKSIYKEFEDNIYKNPGMFTKGEKTFEVIEEYYKIYKTIIGLDEEDENDCNNALSIDNEYANLVTILRDCLKCDDWIPPLLVYYDECGTDSILEFLKKLEEKTLCDLFVGVSLTKRKNERYKIIKLIKEKGKQPDVILNSEELKNSNKERAREKLKNEELYGDRCCKYILLRYEYLLNSHSVRWFNYQNVTVEHVLPQNPKTDEWTEFGKEDRDKWTHNIANLIVIKKDKNSKMSNKDFKEKQEKLRKLNSEQKDPYVGIDDIINKYKEWTPEVLQSRLEEMCDRLFPLR